MHAQYGIPVAVNVGDAMFALCLQPLLDNMRWLGLGKALSILETVARMARESAEGQAIELDWIRHGNWAQPDRSYCQMSFKKTCWYTFIAPLQIGGIIAGVDRQRLITLRRFGSYIGVAFQIQDDILNLVAEERLYGKEIGGDLWEGKHTVMLLHMMRSVAAADRTEAQRILQLSRDKKTQPEVDFLWRLIAIVVAYRTRPGLLKAWPIRRCVCWRRTRNQSRIRTPGFPGWHGGLRGIARPVRGQVKE